MLLWEKNVFLTKATTVITQGIFFKDLFSRILIT